MMDLLALGYTRKESSTQPQILTSILWLKLFVPVPSSSGYLVTLTPKGQDSVTKYVLLHKLYVHYSYYVHAAMHACNIQGNLSSACLTIFLAICCETRNCLCSDISQHNP